MLQHIIKFVCSMLAAVLGAWVGNVLFAQPIEWSAIVGFGGIIAAYALPWAKHYIETEKMLAYAEKEHAKHASNKPYDSEERSISFAQFAVRIYLLFGGLLGYLAGPQIWMLFSTNIGMESLIFTFEAACFGGLFLHSWFMDDKKMPA